MSFIGAEAAIGVVSAALGALSLKKAQDQHGDSIKVANKHHEEMQQLERAHAKR